MKIVIPSHSALNGSTALSSPPKGSWPKGLRAPKAFGADAVLSPSKDAVLSPSKDAVLSPSKEIPRKPFGHELRAEWLGMTGAVLHRPWLMILIWVIAAAAGNAADLQKFADCRLLDRPGNDGDSFHVRAGERDLLIRLYFVDCPEITAASDADAKRVRDQARYFGITDPARIVEFGHQARAFVAEKLAQPFTVHTAFASALGRSTEPRVYAFVTTSEGDDLASRLVEHGLARSFGVRRQTPDAVAADEMDEKLHDLQDTAMLNRAGIWAASDPKDLVRLRAEQRAEERELAEFRDRVQRPASPDWPLDLNTATKGELQSVSGIGPALAARIIAGRPYASVEELRRVSGIGDKLYQRLRPYFTMKRSEKKKGAE